MEKYEELEIEIIVFDAADVIVASGDGQRTQWDGQEMPA